MHICLSVWRENHAWSDALTLTLCSVSSSSSSGLKASAQTWKKKREEISKKKRKHKNSKQISLNTFLFFFYRKNKITFHIVITVSEAQILFVLWVGTAWLFSDSHVKSWFTKSFCLASTQAWTQISFQLVSKHNNLHSDSFTSIFSKMQGENTAATLLCSVQCTEQNWEKGAQVHSVHLNSDSICILGGFLIQRNHVFTDINLGN